MWFEKEREKQRKGPEIILKVNDSKQYAIRSYLYGSIFFSLCCSIVVNNGALLVNDHNSNWIFDQTLSMTDHHNGSVDDYINISNWTLHWHCMIPTTISQIHNANIRMTNMTWAKFSNIR